MDSNMNDKIFTDNLTKADLSNLNRCGIFTLKDLNEHMDMPPMYINNFVDLAAEILIDKNVIRWENLETDEKWWLRKVK